MFGKYIPLCADVEEALADIITLDDDEPMEVDVSEETQSEAQKAESSEKTDEGTANTGQDEERDEKPEERVVTTPEIVVVEEALAEALDDIEQVLFVQEVLSFLYRKPLYQHGQYFLDIKNITIYLCTGLNSERAFFCSTDPDRSL